MDTLSELRVKAKRGGPLRVDASSFSPVELSWLARDMKGTLTLFNAGVLKRHERGWIERDASGPVIYEPE